MGKLLDQIREIQNDFQELELDDENYTLSGRLDVDEKDHFFVEIDFKRWGLMRKFPLVKEIGGRIPPTADRHIFPDSGHCCLTTSFMEEILLRTSIRNLKDFFREVLIPYFLRQIYYEIEGEYDNELAHGTLGILQSYEEVLLISDIDVIISLMKNRIMGHRIGRNDPCYCGANKIKNCRHHRSYEVFRMVPQSVIKTDLEKFRQWRSKKKDKDK
jgi:hypothetical protein